MKNTNSSYQMQGKIAIVTGGTSGIGRATTLAFVKAGARVLFTGRNHEAGQAIENETNGLAVFFHADQRSNEDMLAIVEACVARFGKIDYLYANAGVEQKPVLVADITDEEIDRVTDTNLKGNIKLIRNAIPELINTQGAIVICSSFWGQKAGPYVASYAASKAAVSHFSRCLAVELGEHKIRVNTISPGGVDTKMFRRVLNTQEAVNNWAQDVPLNRPATPQELAETVLWLCDSATYISGQDIAVDGGLSIKMAGV